MTQVIPCPGEAFSDSPYSGAWLPRQSQLIASIRKQLVEEIQFASMQGGWNINVPSKSFSSEFGLLKPTDHSVGYRATFKAVIRQVTGFHIYDEFFIILTAI